MSALIAVSASAGASTPYPTKSMPAPQDVGALTAQVSAANMTATLPLKLRNEAAADALLQSLSAKGSSNYHQFLTPDQFKAQFGQADVWRLRRPISPRMD
jgi:xanthomonalisin